MFRVFNAVKRFTAQEDGLELIEWAVIAGLLAGGVLLLIQVLALNVNLIFTLVGLNMQ